MESGEYRVFGPPGTGKTHYLTKQIARAVETTTGKDCRSQLHQGCCRGNCLQGRRW